MEVSTGKITAVAIVRDSNGKPKFTDINNIPAIFWNTLTKEEKEEIRNDRITLRSNS
mgnify:CR=1 FL=1